MLMIGVWVKIPVNIYESVGAQLCIQLLQRLTVNNMPFIIQSGRNTKKNIIFVLFLYSVGAPVGGSHSIISVAETNCFFFPLAGKC